MSVQVLYIRQRVHEYTIILRSSKNREGVIFEVNESRHK